MLDATFIRTNDSGKELAKIQETLRVPSPETPADMVRYARAMKLINGAVLLHQDLRSGNESRRFTRHPDRKAVSSQCAQIRLLRVARD